MKSGRTALQSESVWSKPEVMLRRTIENYFRFANENEETNEFLKPNFTWRTHKLSSASHKVDWNRFSTFCMNLLRDAISKFRTKISLHQLSNRRRQKDKEKRVTRDNFQFISGNLLIEMRIRNCANISAAVCLTIRSIWSCRVSFLRFACACRSQAQRSVTDNRELYFQVSLESNYAHAWPSNGHCVAFAFVCTISIPKKVKSFTSFALI